MLLRLPPDITHQSAMCQIRPFDCLVGLNGRNFPNRVFGSKWILCTTAPQTPVHRVRVRDDQVGALSLHATDLVGLLGQATEFILDFRNGAEHDHAIAEAELCMGNCAVFVRHDQLDRKSVV